MELTLSNFVVRAEPNSKRYLQFFCRTVLSNLILGTAEAQWLEQREERLLKCNLLLWSLQTGQKSIFDC